MVIEENENANYLAHYKTKGAKNGIRRFQSYLVQPNPSGATGQEIGEAAAQRGRITGKKNDSEDKTVYKSAKELRKEARRQQKLQKIAAKRKKKETDDKEKWSKSYRELAKHKDAFTNEELRRAIDRLELESRITSSSLKSVRDKTQKGADILKNLDSAGRSMAGIYNTLAGGWNVYHEITGKGQKLPKFRGGNESIQVKKPNSNNNNRNNRNNQNNNSQRTVNNSNQDDKSQQRQNNLERIGSHRFDRDKVSLKGDVYDWNITKPDNTKYSFNNGAYLRKRYRNRLRLDSLGDLGPYLEHFGVPGQKWYHRYFQSYKTAPTRSGKVGEEHGLASEQTENKTDEATDKETQLKALQESNRKTLESAGFKDSTPSWYNNYASTKNVKKYSIEMHDPTNDGHSDGVKRTNAMLDVDDNCYEPQIKAAVEFSKNFEKHDATIKDAIVESYFSSPNNIPWLYEKGYADELPLGKRFIEGKSFEEQKKFFRDHLGIRADTTKDKNAFSTGGKSIMLERGGISGEPDDCVASVYYSDGGAYFGHVFTALIDLKTGKVYEVSMGG